MPLALGAGGVTTAGYSTTLLALQSQDPESFAPDDLIMSVSLKHLS